MAVGAVSSVNGMSFREIIRQPQSAVRKDGPLASTTIANGQNQDDNFKYKVAGAVAGTIATGVLLAKTHNAEILQKAAGEDLSIVDKVLNPIKGAITTTGKFIDEKATSAWNTIKGFFSKNENKAEDVVEEQANAATKANENVVNVADDAGKVTEDAGKVTEDAGKVTEDAGKVTDDAGKVTEDAGKVTEDAGK